MGGLGGEEEFSTVNLDEATVEGDGEFYDIPLADEEGDMTVGAEELGAEGTSMAEALFGLLRKDRGEYSYSSLSNGFQCIMTTFFYDFEYRFRFLSNGFQCIMTTFFYGFEDRLRFLSNSF